MAKGKENLDYSKLMEGMDGAGFEEVGLDTMAIPFIRIIQELSPQMRKAKPEFNPDAEEGMFVNTVSGKLYPSPIRVIIGKFQRTFLEWGTTRGNLKGVHTPESIELSTDLMRNEKNQLVDPATNHTFQDCYTYYVLNVDDMDEGICIVSCVSTNIKEARKLNRNLMHTLLPDSNKRALPYFMVWEVSSVDMSNDEGEWKGISFKFHSFVSQAQLTAVVAEREQIPHRRVDYAQLVENTEDKPTTDVPY